MEDKANQANANLPPLPGNPADRVMVLTLYIDKKTNIVSVEGLLANKQLCYNVLAEGLKAVANFQPSSIIKPGFRPVQAMANFGRKIMGRR